METGDKVTIKDGSYAVRVDAYEEHVSIGLCKDIFEVVGIKHCELIFSSVKIPVHDIFIRNTNNGKTYLHSECMVSIVPLKIKEITISELENHYGCQVKVVK